MPPPLLIVCVKIKDCTAGTHGWRGHEIRYWILNSGIPYRTYIVERVPSAWHCTTLLHVQFNTLSKRGRVRECVKLAVMRPRVSFQVPGLSLARLLLAGHSSGGFSRQSRRCASKVSCEPCKITFCNSVLLKRPRRRPQMPQRASRRVM